MATVKIALAVVLLALLTSNGFGLRRMLMRAPECHKVDECNLILRNCKGERGCDNGVCMCFQMKEAKQECEVHTDCENHCPPPCHIPYCDITDSLCKCECTNQ